MLTSRFVYSLEVYTHSYAICDSQNPQKKKILTASFTFFKLYIFLIVRPIYEYVTFKTFVSMHNTIDIKYIFLYKIKNCENNCKMWRIGNCFLSAPVHIPPNEIPHQTPGSH